MFGRNGVSPAAVIHKLRKPAFRSNKPENQPKQRCFSLSACADNGYYLARFRRKRAARQHGFDSRIIGVTKIYVRQAKAERAGGKFRSLFGSFGLRLRRKIRKLADAVRGNGTVQKLRNKLYE